MTQVQSSSQDAACIPRWVTALDVVCVIVLGLMLRSMMGDSYRISFTPEFHISLRSWPRVALWLVALLVIRRIAWRAVPWHVRVAGWARALVTWEPLRAAWGPYILSRVIVLLVGYVAVFTIGLGSRRPFPALTNGILDLFVRWDAGWYFGIAIDGYDDVSPFNPARQSDIAFFPGLPLLMRATGVLLDVNLWVAGIIVVSVAFLWALTYVYRLARLDLTPEQARASVMFLAFYPFAVCYSAVLTESLFLLTAAAAFFYFRRDELWKAGAFGLFAGLLRPNGFLLCVPLGLLAVLPFARSRGWIPETRRRDPDSRTPGHPDPRSPAWSHLFTQLAIATLPVIGMLLYAEHIHSLTGDAFAFVKAQQAWGRRSAELLNIIDARWALIESQGLAAYTRSYTIEIVETAAVIFALGTVWPIIRRFGLAYGVFVAMAVLPPFITMGSVSLGRYTAPLFPIFVWLGASMSNERRPYWIAAFASGQALLAALFYTWRPPY